MGTIGKWKWYLTFYITRRSRTMWWKTAGMTYTVQPSAETEADLK